eukprot:TRINITY_DN1251_c2_g1_i3.p2 TRINITY_DN1251_c2_g1~~TRINITY_DN1251_c2_g1_i3.p2  ORF type:complete len:175 (+),score=41.21 TRINITY_DN1251_c2_g1_i3:817-1341(+)
MQSLFEGTMYTFVFMWTPVLQSSASNELPFGLIFAIYMICVMLGSTVFNFARRVLREELIAIGYLLLAFCAMLTVVFFQQYETVTLAAFCTFELCCGIHWPCVGSIRSRVIPAHARAAVMNLFRVPLNLMVVAVLLKVKSMSHGTVFSLCALWLLLAAACGVALWARVTNLKKN